MVKEIDLSNSCILHEDTFYEYFKPIRHPDAKCGTWGGHGLETFGEELEIVRNSAPDYLWTVVDGDSRNQWITSGFQYVNRVCYLVTEKPHNSVAIEFRVASDGHSLTPLGLKRQVLKLNRLMAKHSISRK